MVIFPTQKKAKLLDVKPPIGQYSFWLKSTAPDTDSTGSIMPGVFYKGPFVLTIIGSCTGNCGTGSSIEINSGITLAQCYDQCKTNILNWA